MYNSLCKWYFWSFIFCRLNICCDKCKLCVLDVRKGSFSSFYLIYSCDGYTPMYINYAHIVVKKALLRLVWLQPLKVIEWNIGALSFILNKILTTCLVQVSIGWDTRLIQMGLYLVGQLYLAVAAMSCKDACATLNRLSLHLYCGSGAAAKRQSVLCILWRFVTLALAEL